MFWVDSRNAGPHYRSAKRSEEYDKGSIAAVKLENRVAPDRACDTSGALSISRPRFQRGALAIRLMWLGAGAVAAFIPELARRGPIALGITTMEQNKRRVGKHCALAVRASEMHGPQASIERLGGALVVRIALRLFDRL